MSAGRSTRALGLVVLLGICLQMASAANIVSGATYYLKLKKSPYCKSTAQYVGYNNKKCGQNGPLLRTKNDGSMSWKRWVVAVKKKESAKSWLVQLTSTWDPKVQKPTCLGRMTVSKPDLCAKGTGVADVKIVGTTSAQQWRLTEVATNTFTIAAANRAAGCYRFLGASGNCSAPNLKLFKADDKKGAQRFILEKQNTPKPSPKPSPRPSPSPTPTPKKAGQPINVRTTTVTTDTWSGAWTDGAAGVPVETYNLACVRPGAGCEATPAAATDGISRGTGAGSVVGLAANTQYDCYVIATNQAGFVCSAPVSVKTSAIVPQDTKAGKPTAVSNTVSGTTWVATWTDGTAGTPQETYTAKCVALNAPCDSASTFGVTKTGVPRGTKAANVTTLPTGAKYSCYIVATNSAGNTCSDPVTVDVTAGAAAGQPTGVTGTLQVTTWAAKWTDGTAGNPVETYTVKCVTINSGCNGTTVGQAATGIARGVQQGAAGPLPNGGAYHCYVIAVNSVSAICSAPQTVTVGTVLVKPGKPTAVTYTRTTTSVTLKWTDGTAGVPVESYAVECYPYPNACNQGNPLGTSAEGIVRGVQTGTASNLPTNTRMNCYAIAYNTQNLADDVCSDPVDVPAINAGDVVPGQPTNVLATPSSTSATFTWTYGTVGIPVEDYQINCYQQLLGGSVPTCGQVVGLIASASVPRLIGGTPTNTITGLTPNTNYYCFVKAFNTAGFQCSTVTQVFTQASIIPGAPTTLQALLGSATQTSLTFQFNTGLPGVPVEDYQIRCSTGAITCSTTVGVLTSASVNRASLPNPPAITINGLTAGTTYNCLVRAKNTAGEVCNTGGSVSAATLPAPNTAPSQPGSPSASSITDTSATITFALSTSPGNPVEQYQVTCYKNPAGRTLTCNTPPAAGDVAYPAFARPNTSPTSIVFTGLAPNAPYLCFVGAYNSETGGPGSAICAPSATAFATDPGAPTKVTDFNIDTSIPITETTATVMWTLPAAATPIEQYRIKCWKSTSGVAPVGLSCLTSSPAPVFTSPLLDRTIPTQYTITGLDTYSYYHCTLAANNGGADVCATTLQPPQLNANYVTFQTLPKAPADPSNVQQVSLVANRLTLQWSLSNPAGIPAESYQIKCWTAGTVLGATACTTAGSVDSTDIVNRPVSSAFIDLTTGSWDCYVLAFNAATYPANPAGGDFCSYYSTGPVTVGPLP